MDAVVGDTEFWLLAKRVVAGGGTVSAGDTVFSLQAKLTNLMGSGGTDSGGGTDPNAVQKTGDTMTGLLVIKGDAWDGGNVTNPTPALMLENAAAGNQVGIAIGQFGDSLTVVKANGQPCFLRMGSFITVPYATGTIIIGPQGGVAPAIDFNDGGGFHCSLGPDSALEGTFGDMAIATTKPGAGIQFRNGNNTIISRLYFDPASGDLIVQQTVGPNAGKSVNLTAGKWA